MPIKRNVPLALELYKVAESQSGYFTARQAKLAGYTDSNFGYYIRRGYWTYCIGGVYRLQAFPMSKNEGFILYALWSHDKEGSPQCIFSHLSALYYYDLIEAPPSHYHMTKNIYCRLAKNIPENIVFYKSKLNPADILNLGSFQITSLQRTFFDIVESDLLLNNEISNVIARSIIKKLLPLAFFEENKVFALYLESIYSILRNYIEVEITKIMVFQIQCKK